MATWVILGCGYVGTRLARALLADGHEVRVAARNGARLAPLAALGARVFEMDAAKRRAFGPSLYGASSAHVVYSVPPIPGSPPGATIARAAEAALAIGCQSFLYLGSTAVYGETPSGDIVDEESPVAISDPEAAGRVAEESAVETARLSGIRTVILRLAAIYGPGRGVRERLKLGSYQLIDDGIHYFSRVHVDDLCGILRLAAERAPGGARYCVADDRTATQREYAEWLCARMGLPLPPSVDSLAPGKRRRPVRNRKVSNARLHAELGYSFRYPSFVEGELAIEAEAAAAGAAKVPVAVTVADPDPDPDPDTDTDTDTVTDPVSRQPSAVSVSRLRQPSAVSRQPSAVADSVAVAAAVPARLDLAALAPSITALTTALARARGSAEDTRALLEALWPLLDAVETLRRE